MFKRLVFLCLALLIPAAGWAWTPEELASYEARAEQMRQQWGDPALAIAIVHGNRVIWSRGFGTLSEDDTTPITPQTLFPAGSISKSFTAAAALQLVHEGQLGLEVPICNWLTDLELSSSDVTQRATLFDLLANRTGFYPHEGDLAVAFGYGADTLYGRLSHLPLRHTFRSRFSYSNWNYFLAGRLIQEASGMPYEQFVKERILQPLGLKQATFKMSAHQLPMGHFWHVDAHEVRLQSMPPVDIRAIAAAGGLFASVEELGRWVALHLQQGRLNGQQILDPWVVDTMQQPLIEMPQDSLSWWYPTTLRGQSVHYGFGWSIQQHLGRKLVGHLGLAPGYMVTVSFMPDENVGIVIMSSSYASLLPIALQLDFYQHWLKPCSCLYVDWSTRLRQQQTASLAEQSRLEREMEEERIGVEPPVPLKGCIGTYTHPFYGTVELRAHPTDRNQLRLLGGPNRLPGRLIPWEGADMRLFWDTLPLPNVFVTQVTDVNERLIGLQVGPFFLQKAN